METWSPNSCSISSISPNKLSVCTLTTVLSTKDRAEGKTSEAEEGGERKRGKEKQDKGVLEEGRGGRGEQDGGEKGRRVCECVSRKVSAPYIHTCKRVWDLLTRLDPPSPLHSA